MDVFRSRNPDEFFYPPPALQPPPLYRWFQDVYALDIRSRLSEIQACVTSVFGQYLKLDSTMKVYINIWMSMVHCSTWISDWYHRHMCILIEVYATLIYYLYFEIFAYAYIIVFVVDRTKMRGFSNWTHIIIVTLYFTALTYCSECVRIILVHWHECGHGCGWRFQLGYIAAIF